VSLAALIRDPADGDLDGRVRSRPTPAAIRAITKLGRSGVTTTSRDHHRALDEALRRAAARFRSARAAAAGDAQAGVVEVAAAHPVLRSGRD
jgi:hypothetical protein